MDLRKQLALATLVLASLPICAKEMRFQKIEVPEFNQIESQYVSDLEIIGGSQTASLTLSGDQALFPYVDYEVDNQVLKIKAPRGVHVIVKPSELKRVSLVGEGFLNAKGLNRAKDMQLSLSGDVNASIRGPIPLRHLVMAGDTTLRLDWLDASQFKLEATDKSKIQISGRCDNASYQLAQASVLDAQYVRCREVHAHTQDRAFADVNATTGLTAYAGGKSQINYAFAPKRLTVFSSKYGQVLKSNIHDNG